MHHQMLKLVEELRLLCKQTEEQQSLTILRKVAKRIEKLPLEDINWFLKSIPSFLT